MRDRFTTYTLFTFTNCSITGPTHSGVFDDVLTLRVKQAAVQSDMLKEVKCIRALPCWETVLIGVDIIVIEPPGFSL